MNLMDTFKKPASVNITGRTSTITNAFVNSILPSIDPTEEQLRKCLEILELIPEDLRCAYCGDKSTEWDHFRPVVENKKPTGYISDIYNLVPSCGNCNESKGNKYWKDWIISDAKLSPKNRKIPDINRRISRLEKYEGWKHVEKIDFKNIVGTKLWEQHWNNCEKLHDMMRESQALAAKIKGKIQDHVRD